MAVEDITVQDAKDRPLLVDVRERDEWDAGHAPDAVHNPMSSFDASRLPPGQRVAVICKVGGRSARVAAHLDARGYTVANVSGGMLAWQAAGLPVVTDAGSPGSVLE